MGWRWCCCWVCPQEQRNKDNTLVSGAVVWIEGTAAGACTWRVGEQAQHHSWAHRALIRQLQHQKFPLTLLRTALSVPREQAARVESICWRKPGALPTWGLFPVVLYVQEGAGNLQPPPSSCQKSWQTKPGHPRRLHNHCSWTSAFLKPSSSHCSSPVQFLPSPEFMSQP